MHMIDPPIRAITSGWLDKETIRGGQDQKPESMTELSDKSTLHEKFSARRPKKLRSDHQIQDRCNG